MDHRILLVEDDELLASNIQNYLERRHFEVRVCHSAEEALQLLPSFQPDLVLTDNALPGMSGHQLLQKLKDHTPDLKLIMLTGHGSVDDAVTAMKEGAFHYLSKPVALSELKLLLDKALDSERLEPTPPCQHKQEAHNAGILALIGESPAMASMKSLISKLLDAERRMHNSDLPPVLIEGETGTGKELVARALHYDGPRRNDPFVEFNCASIPANLIESELFGHEKGAFTDAKDLRVGLVEAANGGTLFLDEIGEMDLLLQAKLLKLLEDRTIRRVGSVKERKVDLRIISATNCNLEQMVQQGKFRRDLFFRLRIISIKVPRLQQRGEDVLLLAQHFLAQHGKRYGKPSLRFGADAQALLLSYSWPGNVRELRNMLEQTVLLTPTEVIGAHQLTLCTTLNDDSAIAHLVDEHRVQVDAPVHASDSMTLAEVSNNKIRAVLSQTDWNVTKSARLLGLSRDMLRYRMEKLGLNKPEKVL
ncbi:sigma-54 dependent transcriptional regulator [Pseudomonas sp. PS01303]|uniref:sigma-54-dependent transcriptional regulator n=1 Tax=Pseudomonas sp. PS01303 TaxID=2991439 RepID=UPI00249BE426|nr:sigma-54 dependent transcriptional regulator [Pseudomonas sp. PS01303]